MSELDTEGQPDCGIAGCPLSLGHRGEHMDAPDWERPLRLLAASIAPDQNVWFPIADLRRLLALLDAARQATGPGPLSDAAHLMLDTLGEYERNWRTTSTGWTPIQSAKHALLTALRSESGKGETE